ncbi:MAG: TetR/AcrR family transcriptional regulator, partial [Alterinioella nitratireducens]
YFSGFAEGYATGLREAEARGEVSPGDAEVRAWALMGMAKALGDRFVLWDDAPDIEHVVEEAHRMICRGLAP